MPLIACRECGQQISDLAPACPKCGVPALPSPQGVVTTQATAKNFKGQQLIGGAVLCLGVVISIVSEQKLVGAAAIGVGLIWYLVARIRAWWNHG